MLKSLPLGIIRAFDLRFLLEAPGMVSLGNIRSWARSNKVILVLLLILLLGSFLRIYDLGAESLWLDEAYDINFAKQSLPSIIEALASIEHHPPLHYVVLHFWMLPFGSSEIATRALSAIFGIISIFLIYQIGCQLFNRKVGLIGSFLSSISYFHIYYSQEVRVNGLLLLLTLLSFFFFIKVLKSDNTRKLYFPLLFLANLCLAYSHVYGLFVIISQIFYFLLFWNRYKHIRIWFLGVQVATLAFFSPWIPSFIGQVSRIAQGFWIPEPSLITAVGTIATYAGSGWGKVLLLLVFLVVCLMGLFSIRRLNGKWTLRRPLESLEGLRWRVGFESVGAILLLLIWFSFPIIIPFIVSKFFTPIYEARNTISASPALYLLAAKGISTFTNRKALYAVVIIAALSLPGLQYYYTHDVKEQWRETADFIEYNSQADDVIIFCAGYVQIPFDYYYEGDPEKFGIGRNVADAQEIAATVDNAVAGKQRLWLILSHEGEALTEDYLIDRFGSDSVIVEKEFVGVKVYLFGLQVESP